LLWLDLLDLVLPPEGCGLLERRVDDPPFLECFLPTIDDEDEDDDEDDDDEL